jgi:hypothetical protein
MPPIQINFPPVDWNAVINTIIPVFFTVISKFIAQGLHDAVVNLLNSQFNVLTHVPRQWTIDLAPVRTLDNNFLTLAARGGVCAMLLAWSGYQVMKGHDDLFDVVFRVGGALILSQASVFWIGWYLDAINAFSDFVTTTDFHLDLGAIPSALELIVMFIVGLWFALKALLKGAAGTVFLAVLCAIAPFALLFLASPMTERWGKWWVGHFAAWSLRAPAVGLVLTLGFAAGSQAADAHMQLLFAIAAFWICDKLPDWLTSSHFQASAWAEFARLRMLERGAALAAGAAGAASTAVAGGARAATRSSSP